MKNIKFKTIILAGFLLSGLSFSQIIIGDAIGTAALGNKQSVLLEYANTNNKGMILPYVRNIPSTPSEGTIILDASVPTTARVKYYNANTTPNSGGWVDISGQDADITTALSSQPIGVNESSAKAIIGSTTSAADGVLVLESTTKAMVLPVVSNTNNIINPSPGMMVYVNTAGAKRLAVYNGAKWSYWMP
ncbi:hypothetical protein [Chryseobacterium balustinum]|uniref:hypothetical protein n=1 Tax=Chryseobacterium balustinum TaxID=246 RepID=UPI003CEF8CCF